MTPEQKQQIAMVFLATCQLQIDTVDNLEGTSLYNQKLKHLSRNIQKECIKIIDSFHNQLDEEQEKYYFKTIDMVETLINCIKSRKIDIMIQLLKEFEKGEILVVDENKHGKFLKQQEKI
ncbi:MAG: hypothetical protein JXQ96_23685 [Cyclobacteriaceae bacterium]